ncbi:MAG: hypothetical protein Q4C70_14625, partial [Planctomycetia bacterium]|nr:hypothetical protein [Planctomycetia bacterium]
ETENGAEMEESENPDRLQFTRRKRSRIYSGEDPVLNFDEATQEVTENAVKNAPENQSSETEKDNKANTDGDSAGSGNINGNDEVDTENESEIDPETSVNVATPGDEAVKEKSAGPRLEAFRIHAPAVEYLPADWVEKLAIPLESVSISGRPVSTLVQFASQMAGERIQADWKQLETLGVSMETPITLALEGTTLRETLETGLYSVGLGVIPVGTNLRVTGWEAAEVTRTVAEKGEKAGKHILELEDLVATFASESSGKLGIGEFERIIPMFVHPALWEKWGGPGRINVNVAKKRITLLQYPSVSQEVELFFDKIRHARNMEMKNLPTASGKRRMTLTDGTEICDTEILPRYALSEKVRRLPITCDLSDGSTLRNTLTELFRCADAKVIMDEAAIARIPITAIIRDADVPDFEGKKPVLPDSILDLPCVYRFEEIPLEEAVSDVLKSVPLCCYPVGRDTFFLTTTEDAQRKMLVDFFQVGDIVKNPEMAGTILNGICETIYPKTWSQNGGRGAIYFDVPSRSFIVRQNPYVIYSIEMFLKQYRERQNPEAQMEK